MLSNYFGFRHSNAANLLNPISPQDWECRRTWCDEAFVCWRNTWDRQCCFPVPRPDNCMDNKLATCFPSASKVTLENGKLVTMSELKTGDKVQTGNKEKKFSVVN